VAKTVKITIIGAGSATFAAGIVRDLCMTPGLHGSHVALMDIDRHRLDMIEILGTRLSRELKAGLAFSKTLSREKALEGSDFVINTAQVGGHPWTESQRSLAEKHGYYRGVRLHDFAQMALMLDVARDVKRICPDAWLIQSSNPVFEGCTVMARETGIKQVGLCHGHYGYRHVANVLGLELEHVTAEMPGFNHWIWMTQFRYKGRDAYPLVDEWIATRAEEYWRTHKPRFGDNQMSRAAIHQYRLYGLMPIGDTPRMVGWWYHGDLATKKKWYGHLGGFDSEIGWGQYLEEIGKRVAAVERAALDRTRPITDEFPAKKTDEQIVPIINSIVHDQPAVYQVNIPNRGKILPGFPEDLVIECQGVVSASGIQGIAVPPMPRRVFVGAMIPRWQRAELVVESFRQGDPQMLLAYLLYEQRTRSLAQAEGLIAEWLADPRNERVARQFGRGPARARRSVAAKAKVKKKVKVKVKAGARAKAKAAARGVSQGARGGRR
jgi:alpha-galactosidase